VSFFLVATSNIIFPGSGLVILPLIVCALEISSSSLSIASEVTTTINYESLLPKEELVLQLRLEQGSTVSDTFAKVHNILIVIMDLAGIYFLPPYIAAVCLPTVYCLERFYFSYVGRLPDFHKIWGRFTVEFSINFNSTENSKNTTTSLTVQNLKDEGSSSSDWSDCSSESSVINILP
jgi:hypothetical protein